MTVSYLELQNITIANCLHCPIRQSYLKSGNFRNLSDEIDPLWFNQVPVVILRGTKHRVRSEKIWDDYV